MPKLQIKSIENVSSEDTAFPASNLLVSESLKKWKCEKKGEKQASIVLRLEKPSIITRIDIGNEYSTYVTISVGKYGKDSEKDFKDILLASSFMSPANSRSGTEPNSVRYFNQIALVEETAKHKWDLVKVLCTQPYNNHVQFGLSFIKFYGIVEEELPLKVNFGSFGQFKLRDDSPDSDNDIVSTSLFSKWKQSKQTTTKTTAAAIREASTPTSLKNYKSLINKEKVLKPNENPNSSLTIIDSDDENKKQNRNRDNILYNEEDDIPNEKFDKKISEDNERREKERNKKTTIGKSTDLIEDRNKATSSSTITKSIDAKDKLKASSTKFRSFIDDNEKDIDVAPRSSAPSPKSTSNFYSNKTDKPKLSSPKISTHFQINNNSATKKRQSSPLNIEKTSVKRSKPNQKVYRKFNKLLNGVVYVISGIQNPERSDIRKKAAELGATYKQDWDDECTHLICAFVNTPKFRQVKGKGKIIKKDWILKCHLLRKHIPWRQYSLDTNDAQKSDSEDEILELTEEEVHVPSTSISTVVNSDNKKNYDDDLKYEIDSNNSNEIVVNSDSDTEEEIERVLKDKKFKDNDLFDKSTDDEMDLNESTKYSQQSQNITGFFQNKTFLLNDNLGAVDVIKLKKFIDQRNGKITKNISDANYILSSKTIGNPSATFNGEILKPLWVYECHDMDCLIPTARYKL